MKKEYKEKLITFQAMLQQKVISGRVESGFIRHIWGVSQEEVFIE
jgi:hypothetical protein